MKQPVRVTVSKDGVILEEIDMDAEITRDEDLGVTTILFDESITVESGEEMSIKPL